jgi:hypothetical protein
LLSSRGDRRPVHLSAGARALSLAGVIRMTEQPVSAPDVLYQTSVTN